MGAVATILTTIAATAGAVAAYRFVDGKRRELREFLREAQTQGRPQCGEKVVDYERDPETGVYKPKSN